MDIKICISLRAELCTANTGLDRLGCMRRKNWDGQWEASSKPKALNAILGMGIRLRFVVSGIPVISYFILPG